MIVNDNDVPHIVAAARELQTYCYGQAKTMGWWKTTDGSNVADLPYSFSNKLMLTVSELSEAMEGDRKNKMDDHLPTRTMREVELADAVIRIFDMAGGFNIDLAGAIAEKLRYNAQRADHQMANRKKAGGKAY